MDIVLMVGCSGSGKSFKAYELYQKDPENTVVLSTDDTVKDSNDKYIWSTKYLGLSHKLNQMKAEEACNRGFKTVVIDNTNLTKRDRKPYEDIAKKYGYKVKYLEPETSWKNNPEECAARSVHLDDVAITKRQLEKKDLLE